MAHAADVSTRPYLDDPYVLEFEARVVARRSLPDGSTGIVLDRTYFYPTSGGQPQDTPFSAVRLSPFFAPPDGVQLGFNGDYSGLAVSGTTAHPIWSDTRNSAVITAPTQGVVHDEDVFTDSRPIPSGEGRGDDNQNN